MPSIEKPISECLKCGGPCWDNRQNKKSPKGPDFKCKDKDCGEAYWLKDAKPAAKQTTNGHGPKWTWQELSATYRRSLLEARKSVIAMTGVAKLEPTVADFLSAGATVFIAATRDGVKPDVPKQEPPPEPEGDDDSIPF